MVGILLTCGKYFHDLIISLRGEVWVTWVRLVWFMGVYYQLEVIFQHKYQNEISKFLTANFQTVLTNGKNLTKKYTLLSTFLSLRMLFLFAFLLLFVCFAFFGLLTPFGRTLWPELGSVLGIFPSKKYLLRSDSSRRLLTGAS
jgi:hypothetical protein